MSRWLQQQPWVQKYDQLSQREKILVVTACAVVLFLLIKNLGFGRFEQQRQTMQAQLEQARQKESQLQAQLQVFQQAAGRDPDRSRRQRLELLRQQLQQQDQALSKLAVGLIPAQQLPSLLQEVLRSSDQLKLEHIGTQPVAELTLAGKVAEEDNIFAEEKQSTGVYKHSVVLTLQGDFFAIRDYLAALEQLPWRLYWEALDYDVLDYPRARVSLEVYTLSTNQGVFNG
jgi:MSHA biogenesis protein MshJ